ncbi:SDR family oxidoreductase [Pigmentiphaga soli]|uniref:SDR family oxidoreductase n=1 Tax=Pigmentiphaga soli TaxID=1007095 RepID=A0ABP8GHD7_9BURK
MDPIGQHGKGLDFSCRGQRALVTGAASGIGRVIAEALLDAQAQVYVCDVSAEALAECEQALPGVRTARADVSDAGQVDAMFARIAEDFGGLDILVNNAGVTGPVGPIEDNDPAQWERNMQVNVNGMFYCTRRAVPMLKQAGGGAIVNTSSVAGRMGYPGRAGYAASKWGVVGLTRSLSAELGPHNIRVNAVLPGTVEGERHERLYAERAKRQNMTFQEAEALYTTQVALRRFVTPRDIAAAVVFLCSPAARNISGQALGVCGDVQYMR